MPERESERSMLDRLNVRYAKTYLNGTSEGRQFMRAEHVQSAAGFSYGSTRVVDFLAIDMFVPKKPTARERTLAWGQRNGSIHGHEVKISRSDWLTELRDPTKAEAWARHCHHWWLVAPREVVRDDLPDGWGLLVPWRDSLRVVVQAALAPIRAALDGHPVCDVHPDDDPVSCGWKRAVADVRRALDA